LLFSRSFAFLAASGSPADSVSSLSAFSRYATPSLYYPMALCSGVTDGVSVCGTDIGGDPDAATTPGIARERAKASADGRRMGSPSFIIIR
jgi:hypothetical protein